MKISPGKTSLVVGYPIAQNSSSLGALHRKFGIRQSEKLDLINGYAIEVPKDKLDQYLEALPQEASVMIDKPFFETTRLDGLDSVESPDDEPPYVSRPAGLEELHLQGIDGQGTTIAVVDSGIAPHPDFGDRLTFFKDFSSKRSKSPSDPNGHGTHVAGIALGDGPLIDGIAPLAQVVGLRITSPREAIKAIEWAVENKDKHHLDILNISLGVPDRLPNRKDPFAQATQRAIEAGIITIVAAGNEGRDCRPADGQLCHGTISSPGSLPEAITVGAYNDAGTLTLEDDSVWARSSAGPTAVDGTAKPDLVAPGVRVLAPTSGQSNRSQSNPAWKNYHFDNGSSLATPMVTGAAALLLQVKPGLNQQDVKKLLTQTAVPIEGTSPDVQGAGRLSLTDLLAQVRSSPAD